ncbi:MAG TPA: hypothetical protein VG291_02095 [Xanthobacteraceae bacterium]|nr:hypothetical protein [Xanthobacteraceae bacterium]
MTWTTTNLLIQVIAGIVGGLAAAGLAKEHSFGTVGHIATGALGGAFSGYFLQTLAGTMVTGAGTVNESDPVGDAILQGLTGLVAGAIVTLIVGFVKHSMGHHKAGML